MEGLYKRVVRGIYPKLPKHYSKDMSMIIKVMLRVNPTKRPTSTQILNTNIISSRMNTLFPNEANMVENLLLQTIYVPKKLINLADCLPKRNYEGQDRSEDGTEFSEFGSKPDDSLPKISQKVIRLPTKDSVSIQHFINEDINFCYSI